MVAEVEDVFVDEGVGMRVYIGVQSKDGVHGEGLGGGGRGGGGAGGAGGR